MNNTGYCYCPDNTIGKHCENYRCTFDRDYCQSKWYQDRNDKFDWYRRSYSTGVSNTGPSFDHTTGIYIRIVVFMTKSGIDVTSIVQRANLAFVYYRKRILPIHLYVLQKVWRHSSFCQQGVSCYERYMPFILVSHVWT